MKTENDSKLNVLKIGFYSSLFLAVITLVTFGFAMTSIPIAGAFCPGNCIEYPYLNTLSQFPGDYLWMFLAIIQILTYIIFMVSIHFYALNKNKIFSHISLTFAIISSSVLLLAYFIQFSVIPASLMNDETEGIALLTQYNPHGIFIALEELGCIMMTFSFLFIAPVFVNTNRVEKAIRWIFIIAFVLTFISFVVVSINHGIVRKDRFEVVIISINWLVLISNGILVSIVFKRALKNNIID
ncbi:MAG: hypothetical protein PF485_08675 [Bacteroidales bacterium]|jgi:hypothetical protein|nr:hypothetical protein [Bacteroidales bacterium]